MAAIPNEVPIGTILMWIGGEGSGQAQATATLNAVALASLDPARDYFTITEPDGTTHGFWFAGGRIQAVAKANLANQDYFAITLASGVVHSFWFQVGGADTENPASAALVAAGAEGSASHEVDVTAATDETSVGDILVTEIEAAISEISATNAAGLVALALDTPGDLGATIEEAVADAGFTVALSDTVPAAVEALDNAVPVDISTGTTSTNMADAIEAAVDAEFTGLLTSANVAAALTITVTAKGTAGNSYVLTENVGHADFTIVDFAGGGGIPTDFLECNGQEIDRTDYADLFAIVGTTYSVGDGADTFNLPNFNGRAPFGAGKATGLTTRAPGETAGAEETTLAKTNLPAIPIGPRSPDVAKVAGMLAAGKRAIGDDPATANLGDAEPISRLNPLLCVQFIIRAEISA